jgi:hypothetical protein
MLLYPDIRKTRVIFPSTAEEVFYDKCLKNLSEDWSLYFSVCLSTINSDEGAKDNEIDFLLYHPRFGIFVVEVKGGRLSYDPLIRKFYSVNRHDEKFEIKDPFKQVLVWKSRFLRFLKQRNIVVPVTHLVCFPSVDSQQFGENANFNSQIIIGRKEMEHLEEFLANIATKVHLPTFLQFKDVAHNLNTALLGQSFTSKLYLRDYIDGHELRMKDVEHIYESLVIPITAQTSLGIEGEAGTGKTMLATMVAKHFREQSQRVLLLTSNPILNLFLKGQLHQNIAVETYLGIAIKYGVDLLNPPADFKGNKSDWIQIDAPLKLQEAIKQKKNLSNSNAELFDVMICDEAQDVQPFWWEALLELKKNEESRLYLFFDRSQGIFGSGGNDKKFDPNHSLPIPPPFFPLINNYRTTREIASFARSFRTGDSILTGHCGRIGYVPELIVYEDDLDCQRQIGKILRKLIREENLFPNEITLLSARDPSSKNSTIRNLNEIAKFKLHRIQMSKKMLWENINPTRDFVGVSTISSFKGLETKVGILINLSEYNLPSSHPIMSSLIYVACTRAKHMLYIFVKKGDEKETKFKAVMESILTNGSLVLEGSEKDFEFVGKVQYFNPLRVGWLTVDDPAFQKKSVMFFPHDLLHHNIDPMQLKIGTKVKFRPMLEGTVAIAGQLKLIKGGS